MQERDELARLNTRLSVYIERVKNLVAEYANISVDIETTKLRKEEEVSQTKITFEKELNDVRKRLHEASKEKERIELESGRNAEYKIKYDDTLQKLTKCESKLVEIQKVLDQTIRDKQKIEGDLDALRKENIALKEEVETSKSSHEKETLLRVSYERQLQSTKEEMNFQNKTLYEELQEKRKQIEHVEKEKVQIRREYKLKEEGMAEKLQELQVIYDKKIETLKNDVQNLHLAEYEELKEQARDDAAKLVEARENNRELTKKFESFRDEHNVKVESLQQRLKDLESSLDDQKRRAKDTINLRDEEIRTLRKNMEEKLEQYKHLMVIKGALDMQLAAYRKLLEAEEVRLNIAPPASSVFGDKNKQKHTNEKKRTEDLQATTFRKTASATGNIKIIAADSQGKFVKLFNSATKEESMGGLIVTRIIDKQEPISYKFPPKFILRGGQSVTIWANQGGGQHKPPTDLVYREQSSWGTGKKIKTAVTDNDGKEVARLFEEEVVVGKLEELHVI